MGEKQIMDINIIGRRSSRTNSETIKNLENCEPLLQTGDKLIYHEFEKDDTNKVNEKPERKGRRRKCRTALLFIVGVQALTLGICTSMMSIMKTVTDFRMRMVPGFPPYNAWKNIAPEVLLKVHVFSVKNHLAFISGEDIKLEVEDIGPIVYREYTSHDDVEFHDNSTLSYTARRRVEFLPGENEEGILNKSIIVPNFAVLATASQLYDASMFMKIGFNLLKKSTAEDLFLNLTVYQYLWNFTTPMIENARTFVPFMVPIENSGFLFNIYDVLTDRYNVKIGPKYGDEDFFKMNFCNGESTVPGFSLANGDCDATIKNSTEGVHYGQYLTKDEPLIYWRKTVCRPMPLYYQKEKMKGTIKTYHYVLPADAYDRKENLTADCYKKSLDFTLPDGLSDVSKCYYDMPFVASFPHFYQRTGPWENKLSGFNPNEEQHGSFITVEPISGVPIEQCARSQSNIYIPPLSGFTDDLEKFSDMVLPLFWLEYYLKDLTFELKVLLYLIANVLPIVDILFPVIMIPLGAACLSLAIIRLTLDRGIQLLTFKSRNSKSYIDVNSEYPQKEAI